MPLLTLSNNGKFPRIFQKPGLENFKNFAKFYHLFSLKISPRHTSSSLECMV